MPPVTVYQNEELLPSSWRQTVRPGDAYVFNPSITRYRDSLLLAYRVVLPDRRRRLALCRLDSAMHVVPGSVVPLSDHLDGAGDWHADPRFCLYDDRLLVHFNSGLPHRGANDIFVVEIDPGSLHPSGAARQLVLPGRQTIEKNWMLFEHDADMYAVYGIAPHIVLRLDLGVPGQTGPIECRRVHQVTWDASAYADRYGELRGGTPPIRHDNVFYTFFHSTYPIQQWRALVRRLGGDATARRTYVAGFYGFKAAPPFTPIIYTPAPVVGPRILEWRHRDRLDPGVARCVYPGGAILRDGSWIVAAGVQNEYCCLESFSHADLLASAAACRARDAEHDAQG
ncbi:MAG: hypothetical protein ABI868_20515 [Acidobacteriota bacterium]